MAKTPRTKALVIACLHFRAWELSIRLTVFKVSEVWRVLMSPKAIAIVVKATLML